MDRKRFHLYYEDKVFTTEDDVKLQFLVISYMLFKDPFFKYNWKVYERSMYYYPRTIAQFIDIEIDEDFILETSRGIKKYHCFNSYIYDLIEVSHLKNKKCFYVEEELKDRFINYLNNRFLIDKILQKYKLPKCLSKWVFKTYFYKNDHLIEFLK